MVWTWRPVSGPGVGDRCNLIWQAVSWDPQAGKRAQENAHRFLPPILLRTPMPHPEAQRTEPSLVADLVPAL